MLISNDVNYVVLRSDGNNVVHRSYPYESFSEALKALSFELFYQVPVAELTSLEDIKSQDPYNEDLYIDGSSLVFENERYIVIPVLSDDQMWQ